MKPRIVFRPPTLAFCICCIASAAHACSVPVFRYALDHWNADLYRLELDTRSLNDSKLSPLLRNLGDSSPVNLRVITTASSIKKGRLLFPHDEASVWSGDLDSAEYSRLIQSPARTELVKRLLSGDSGVWIFVESGQSERDTSEFERLEKRLRFLESVAALPTLDPADPSNQLGPGPELRVGFSVIRVASGDREETILKKMLFGPQPDGSITGDGPIGAVVFGRGRVLGAWPLRDLPDEAIDQACLFLLGACSCQVKNLNPGWDLLLSADWDSALMAVSAAENSDLSTNAASLSTTVTLPETVTIQPSTDASDASPGGDWLLRRTILGALAAGFLLASVLLIVRCRSSKSKTQS